MASKPQHIIATFKWQYDESNVKWIYFGYDGDGSVVTGSQEPIAHTATKNYYNSALGYISGSEWWLICFLSASPTDFGRFETDWNNPDSGSWQSRTSFELNSEEYYQRAGFSDSTPYAIFISDSNYVFESCSLEVLNSQSALIEYCTSPLVVHSWHSVGSISGKLGTFNLSTIKDTDINNGDPVSNATSSAFNVLQLATKLSVLAENKSELTPVIYTDDINYLSLKDLTNNKCELKFYLHNRSFLKITNVSTNAFLSILIDEENKAAKPSIIYKNGSSYSYNQEEPSADTMKHLYEWLMVNEQNIKKKTGLWKTSFAFEKLED